VRPIFLNSCLAGSPQIASAVVGSVSAAGDEHGSAVIMAWAKFYHTVKIDSSFSARLLRNEFTPSPAHMQPSPIFLLARTEMQPMRLSRIGRTGRPSGIQ
jgi:hypothetical protein